MFEKITEAEINERSMANVSTTPNRPTAFGESKMDAQALKLRFDRLSRYLAGRLNEIFEALDEGTFAQAVYINHEGRKVNLETFITNLLTGEVSDIQIQTADGIVYLTELGNKVQEMYNGQYTGDLAGNITIVDGVTLKKFYEDFLEMENQGQGEPGKSAYDYAVEGGYQGTEEEFAKKLATDYPSKVSQLENDEKYITASGAPVQTVNGKTGNVSLSADDVGARPNTWTPTAYEVKAEPVNTVSTHNASDQAHNDIRIELRNLANKINDLLDSDDENLNELHEIVEYIKNNHTLISNITTSKVSVADIVNDLVTSLPNKPLSAAQGVALKALIDAITVPTKLSQLENDKGYITGYTESDPTVPEWAKATSKPSYTKSEVGLANVDNVKQYSASNPPPYPVKSVNNKTGNVTITAGDVGARPNTWTPTAAEVGAEKSGNVAAHNTNTAAHNDIRLLIEGLSNRINAIFDSEDTDLDELSEIVAYIKSNKDLIDAITTSKVSVSDIIDNLETSDSKKPLSAKQGVVLKALIDAITIPTKLSQLDNDKKFITKSEAPVQTVNNKTGNVELDAEDVGARPNTWTPTASEVGARPDNWIPTAADVGARPDDWTPTASDVGARPATWMPSYSDVGAEKAGNVATHNTNAAAHNDIRVLIQGLTDRINAVLDSDDKTLDELSEIVAYIKANKTLIESVTTNKVNVSDIINNLETFDSTKPLSAEQGAVLWGWLVQIIEEFGSAVAEKANKSEGVFFIKGEGTTAGTWFGVCDGIDSYYDGLMIAYKVGVAGASTTTLNINNLGAVKVVKNNNTGISTSFAVNSVIFLVYTVDGTTAYWKAHDYDANTRNSVGDYQKNNTKLYFVGTTTTDDATSTSYATSYTNSKVYVDANNVFNAESGFKGNLTGNADTATKATQDGNGNNIANTYETKADAEVKFNHISSEKEALADKVNEIEENVNDIRAESLQQVPLYANSVDECTDTSKLYVLPDGYIYAYKTVTTEGGTEEVTEQITGEFTEGYRLSTSSGNLSSLAGAITTPLIDITGYGEVFTIHLNGGSPNSVYWGATSDVTGNSMCLYKANATSTPMVLSGYTGNTRISGITYVVNAKNDVYVTFDTKNIDALGKGFTHIRFSGATGNKIDSTVFVTYQKVTEGGTEQKWANTGRAFVPADYEERIIDLEKAVSSLKSSGSASVPYYVLEEAEEVADKVLGVRNANSFVMAIASDLHTNGLDASSVGVLHAGQAMDAINSMTQLDLVALLGDYEIYNFNYGDDNGADETEDARKSFKHVKKAFTSVAKGVPFMQLQGNHDQDTTDTTAEARQKYYAYIGANNVGTVTDYNNKFRNYGYRDFDNYKIRVIYLNTTDVSEAEVTTNAKVSTEQLNWLNTVALNLTDPEWGIIVLTHHPLNWEGVFDNTLLSALDTYKGKNTGAKLIAHFHGHLHNFRAETLGTNKILTITIPNACNGRENEYGTAKDANGNYVYSENQRSAYGDTDASGNQRKFPKTANSANDTSFNVVVVDRENEKVHAICYGAGIHRTITFGGVKTEEAK